MACGARRISGSGPFEPSSEGGRERVQRGRTSDHPACREPPVGSGELVTRLEALQCHLLPTGADRFPQALEVIADGDEDVQHHGSSAQRIPATGTSPIRHRRPQMPRTSVLSHDFWDVSGCAGAWATMSRFLCVCRSSSTTRGSRAGPWWTSAGAWGSRPRRSTGYAPRPGRRGRRRP